MQRFYLQRREKGWLRINRTIKIERMIINRIQKMTTKKRKVEFVSK